MHKDQPCMCGNFQILKWAAYIQPENGRPFSYHYLVSSLRYSVIFLYYYMAAQSLMINVREHLTSELGRAYLAWKFAAIFVSLSDQLIDIFSDLFIFLYSCIKLNNTCADTFNFWNRPRIFRTNMRGHFNIIIWSAEWDIQWSLYILICLHKD